MMVLHHSTFCVKVTYIFTITCSKKEKKKRPISLILKLDLPQHSISVMIIPLQCFPQPLFTVTLHRHIARIYKAILH